MFPLDPYFHGMCDLSSDETRHEKAIGAIFTGGTANEGFCVIYSGAYSKNSLDTLIGCTDVQNPCHRLFRGDAKPVKPPLGGQV